jgi:hypothetical protein
MTSSMRIVMVHPRQLARLLRSHHALPWNLRQADFTTAIPPSALQQALIIIETSSSTSPSCLLATTTAGGDAEDGRGASTPTGMQHTAAATCRPGLGRSASSTATVRSCSTGIGHPRPSPFARPWVLIARRATRALRRRRLPVGRPRAARLTPRRQPHRQDQVPA